MSLVVGVDVGGTFTDLVLFTSDSGNEGPAHVATWKTLTTPHDPSEGIVAGLRMLTDDHGIQLSDVDWIVHGTTIASNVVVEGKGAEVGLLTTAGFEDIVQMGRQYRHNPFDVVALKRHSPLVKRRMTIGVPERIRADGAVHVSLDEAAVHKSIITLRERGARSLAVAFLHSYRFPQHELRVAEIARDVDPNIPLSLSHEVTSVMREYVRFATTVVNAYVRPSFTSYLDNLQKGLGNMGFNGQLLIMKANGGTAWPSEVARIPIQAIESGPAAGVHFASQVGKLQGRSQILAFDMGGTTAKASLVQGDELPLTDSLEVDLANMRPGTGLPIAVPSVDLAEVGAGGGSIATTSLGVINVGPESAGAEPGPAAYGRGGDRPTVTDAALVMGHLGSGNFLGGRMWLDEEAARVAVERGVADPLGLDTTVAAWGIAETAVTSMVHAVGAVSVDAGVDVRGHTLIATGGAGPLHATRVARRLGITEVLVPPTAGVGSAVGLVDAPPRWDHIESVFLVLSDAGITTIRDAIEQCVDTAASKTQVGGATTDTAVFVSIRYQGQGHSVEVPVGDPRTVSDDSSDLRTRFEREYKRLFGFINLDADLIVTEIRVSTKLSWPERVAALKHSAAAERSSSGVEIRRRPVYSGPARGWVDSPVLRRSELASLGSDLPGPAVIEDDESTCLLLENDTASILPGDLIRIEVSIE